MSDLIIYGGDEWPFEQIKFDPSNPEELPEETHQYVSYSKEHKWVRHIVRSKWLKTKSQLSIEYRAEDQTHLPEGWPLAEDVEFWGWGLHILTIEPGKNCGPSTWQNVSWPESECGHGWRLWKGFGAACARAHARYHGSRREAGFREMILDYDDHRCVLTCEATTKALDAAHLIPAAMGENDVPPNGITLRADLHRLFDAGLFTFAADGRVVEIAQELSEAYRRDLHNSRLPTSTLARVRETLTLPEFRNRPCDR